MGYCARTNVSRTECIGVSQALKITQCHNKRCISFQINKIQIYHLELCRRMAVPYKVLLYSFTMVQEKRVLCVSCTTLERTAFSICCRCQCINDTINAVSCDLVPYHAIWCSVFLKVVHSLPFLSFGAICKIASHRNALESTETWYGGGGGGPWRGRRVGHSCHELLFSVYQSNFQSI